MTPSLQHNSTPAVVDRDTSAYLRFQAEVERTRRPQSTDGGPWISHRKRFDVALCNRGCYGIGEMPAPNHKGRQTSGGSHGDDTDSDGAWLTGPQPYKGDKREFPRYAAGSP